MREASKKYLQRPKHEDGSSYNWYVFYSGKASLIGIESLLQSLETPYQVWIPGYKVCQIKRNDVVTSIKKAFPGYVFVSFLNNEPLEEKEREGWLTGVESLIKGQDAQFKILRWPSGRVAGFKEDRLEEIDTIINGMNQQLEEVTDYQPGEFVRIISGPFASMVGQVEEVRQKMLVLKIFFLKQQVKMDIPIAHLQFLIQKA